jgi:hypothetical protein
MAGSFEGVLSGIPGLAGYMASKQNREQSDMGHLQQAGVLQGILSKQQDMQTNQFLRGVLSQTNGDPEEAMKIAIKSGNIDAAHKLAPVVETYRKSKMMEGMKGLDLNSLLDNPNAALQASTANPSIGPELERLRKLRDEGRALESMKGVDTQVSPNRAVIPPQADQAATDAALLAKFNAMPSGPKSVSAVPAGEPIQMSPTVNQKQGGAFSQFFGSEIPALAAQARSVQGQVDSGKITGAAATDRLKELNSRQSAFEAAQAGRQMTIDNRVVPPGAIDAIPPEHSHLTGQAYLDTLPIGAQNKIKAVVEGRVPLTSFSVRNNQRDAIIQQATQYDPSFTAALAPARAANYKNFTSGVEARNITSNNMAISHLGTFYDLGQAIDNGDVKLFNTIKNRLATELGKPEVNNMAMSTQAVGEELMRVFRQVNASESEAKMFMDKLSTSSSTAQIKGAASTAVELMKGRLDALNDQWRRGSGTEQDFPNIVSPKSQAVLQRMGIGGALGGGSIPEFATEADAIKSGKKGKVKIGGRTATIQ